MVSKEIMYGVKFGSKTFVGTTTKDAYMKAVKWYATAVISKDDIHDVHVEFIKSKTEPKVTLVLWAALGENAAREEYCSVCREVHTVFYSNTDYDCSRCSVLGYLKRLEQKLFVKASYCKEVIGKHNKSGGTDE